MSKKRSKRRPDDQPRRQAGAPAATGAGASDDVKDVKSLYPVEPDADETPTTAPADPATRTAGRADDRTDDSDSPDKDDRDAADDAEPLGPEDQRQRWLKYGTNVLLTGAIVVVLAFIVIYLTNARDLRIGKKTLNLRGTADLTSDSSNSLKPQTVSILHDLPAKVTLVNLYPKLKDDEKNQKEDTRERVQNILEQYQRYGNGTVEIRSIDPIAEPSKLAGWVDEVKRQYGKNIPNYERFLKEEMPKTLKDIQALADAEAKQIDKLFEQLEPEFDKLTPAQGTLLKDTMRPAASTVKQMPELLSRLSDASKDALTDRIPNYAQAVKIVRDGIRVEVGGGFVAPVPGLSGFSKNSEILADRFDKLKDNPDAPDAVKQYAAGAAGRFKAMKAKADEALAASTEEKLGSLKLDEVRRKLIPPSENDAPPPAIVVMGENDVKVIDFDSVWKSGQSTGLTGTGSDKPRLRFAGEQQLTSAILSLSQPKKQKVAFVRGGGPPLTDGSAGESGYSEIAERLRSYNFDIVEKDASGQWAMMAAQQRMPAPPEPGWDEIKDAVWVVSPTRPDMRNMQFPSPALADNLKKHLAPQSAGDDLAVDAKDDKLVRSAKHPFTPDEKGDTLIVQPGAAGWRPGAYKVLDVKDGAAQLENAPAPAGVAGGRWQEAAGTALVLMTLEGDDMSAVLKDWGIQATPDHVTIHEAIKTTGDAPAEDFVEQARRVPHLFVLNEYGDHPVVRPLRSLDGAFIAPVPVRQLRVNGSDLAVDSVNRSAVRSAAYKFDASDVNRALLIQPGFGAGGFKGGKYTIKTVSPDGLASLDRQPFEGDAASTTPPTGGKWELDRLAPLADGLTVTPILPIPEEPKSWAESDLSVLEGPRSRRGGGDPTLDETAGDIPGPLTIGAVAARKDGGKLVVLGPQQLAADYLLHIPDPKLAKNKLNVARFPGNGELFTNSVFWLSGNDRLIALSPSAMETARIENIGPTALGFWRVGVFLVGLPVLALLAGFFVYQSRRD